MATSSGAATSGGGDSKPNQAKRSSSKLDTLLAKLHKPKDVPASSSSDRNSRSGSSRRKPKVVQKVMESADNTEDDEDDEYVELNGDASPSVGNGRVNGEGAGSHDEEEEKDEVMDTTVDEHGNHFLADGTMVVQPEAVVERKAQFKGPEFSKSRKVHPGDLDKVTCTGCNKQVNPNKRNAARRHPVLKVLICKKCYDWYTSDEIDQDSDGMDEQCRWCGEGGNLLCCDFCHNAFCRGCIKRNLGRAEVSTAENDEKWHCYVCNHKPLKKLMNNCTEILDMVDKLQRQTDEKEARVKPPATGPVKGKGKSSTGKGKSSKGAVRQAIPKSPGFKLSGIDYEITPCNVQSVLDRLTGATTSFQMFLSSLSSDYNKYPYKKEEVQIEVAKKLKRAMLAYKKMFCDIESFAHSSQQVKDAPPAKKLNFPTPTKASQPKPKSPGTKQTTTKTGRLSLPKNAEVIELSDSDEGPTQAKTSRVEVSAKKEEKVKTDTQSAKSEATELNYSEQASSAKESESINSVKDVKEKLKPTAAKKTQNRGSVKEKEKETSSKDDLKTTESPQENGRSEEAMETEADTAESKSKHQDSDSEGGLEASQDLFDDCISQLKGLDDSGVSAESPPEGPGGDTTKDKVKGIKTKKYTGEGDIIKGDDKSEKGPDSGEETLDDKEKPESVANISKTDEKLLMDVSSDENDQTDIPTTADGEDDKEAVVDDLPSADKDVEDYNQGDFLSVYRAALDAEINKGSQIDEDEEIEERDAEIDGESDSDDDIPLTTRAEKTKPQGRKRPKKEEAKDESDDSEDEEERPKKVSKGKKQGKKQIAEPSSDDDDRSTKRKVRGKGRKGSKDSDSDDEKKTKVRGKGRKGSKDSDSDDEKKTKSKSKGKGKSVKADTDSESDDDDDEPPKKTPKEKQDLKSSKPKIKKDDSDEETESKAPTRSSSRSKGKAKKEDSDSESQTPAADKGKGKPKMDSDDDDDDDSDRPRTSKGKGKGKGKSSSVAKKSTGDEASPKKKVGSRSREDIEAQRMMHQELLEGDSSDEEKEDKEDDSDSDDSLQESSSSDSDDEAQVSDYDPKADIKQARADRKLSRTETAKRKTQDKFSELKSRRQQQKEKQKEKANERRRQREMERRKKKRKGKKDSSDESSSDSEDEKPAKKKPKAKTFFDDLSETSKKKTKKGKKSKDSDSDSDSEEEKKPITKKSKKVQSEDSDSDTAKSKKSKKVKAEKKKSSKDDSDSEDTKVSKKKEKPKKEKKEESEEEKETDTKKTIKDKSEKKETKDKVKPEKEKVKKEKKKKNSDSSDHDSDLEKEIDKLAKDKVKPEKEKVKKGKKKNSDSSDHDSDLEKEIDKLAKDKVKPEKEKVKKEKKKKNSDSSDHDSDLEKEIDKLASLPAKNPKKKKDAEDSTKEDKRKTKKSEDKTPDKSMRLSRKERAAKKGVNIDELGSGSDDKEDAAEDEDMDVDQANDSDPEDAETLKKLRLMAEEQAADEQARSALLADDSDSALSSASSDDEDEDKKKKKEKAAVNGGTSDSSDVKAKPRKKVRSTALLNAKISDSEDSEINGIDKKKKKGKKKDSDEEEFELVDEEDEEDDEAMAELLEEEDENGIVSVPSDSDASVGKKKKKKKKKKKGESESEEEEEEEEDGKKKGKKGKGKRKRKRIKAMSDSSEPETEDSDAPKPKKKKRKKKKGSGDEEEEEEEKKEKVEGEEEGEGEESDENTPGKKRKNIKKIIKDKKLSQDTKTAAKAEEERRKRVQDRQKLYNLVQEEKEEEAGNKVVMATKLVLETDKREGKEGKVLIEVHKDIINKLKPHQVEAVKFLWDCLVESLDMVKSDPGAGCILAHCMGLGKTLSMITLIHTLLNNKKHTKQRTCIVVCPLNTVLNWENEFEKWQPEDAQLDVYELTTVKDNWGRADRLKDWHEGGGILIMGYEMYRNLSQSKRVRNKKQKKVFAETLVDPGPDLVVCDEGHILKNDKSSTSIAMNGVRTQRRVVLTGTPLQNNLGEYHCMVNFVKPNLLGTRKEFSNRFVNPITNGQCANASKWDVKLMKKRAHILHETLAGCVQRRDYAALTKFLPPKHEYILSIRLSNVQCDLYAKYLDMVGRSGTIEKGDVRGASLFSDYQNLSRIWTHPWILRLHEVREQNKRIYDDEDSFVDDESDLEDSFIDDSDSDDSDPKWRKNKKKRGMSEVDELKEDQPKAGTSSGKRGSDHDSDVEIVKKWNTRSRGRDGSDKSEPEEEVKDERLSKEWWAEYVKEDDQYKLELSGKLFILAEVLKMSEAIGDKVLVFSQSLLSLDLIEDFLEHWDKAIKPDSPEEQVAGSQSWTHGIDYFRMDGSTNSQLRKKWSEIFNDRENPRARLFLISTKAGSLGTNMVGANRCIIFDASWNPTHDVQSIFRVYRFGQTKPVYIYRFLAQGTMEEKIYERQVTKQSLSSRVVDEHQIERHFTSESLQELYNFTPERLDDPDREERPTPVLPKDRMLAEMLVSQKDYIVGYHEHDSLLENQIDEELSEEDRKAAWEEYEAEKKGLIQRVAMPNYQQPRMSQPSPYNQMMAPPSMNVFPHLTEVARAIRSANPNVGMGELQQRLEHYMRLQMSSQQNAYQQQLYQQHQMQQRYGMQQQPPMMSGPEPGEVTFMGYGGEGAGAGAGGRAYADQPQQAQPDQSSALYSMLNGSKKE